MREPLTYVAVRYQWPDGRAEPLILPREFDALQDTAAEGEAIAAGAGLVGGCVVEQVYRSKL